MKVRLTYQQIMRAYSGPSKGVRLLRGVRLRWWGRLWGARVGRRVELERGVQIRWGPHAGLVLGDGVYLGRGVVLDVQRGARLTIGAHAKVMHYSVVGVGSRVDIGRFTQIAEHCSVRDSDHDTAATGPMVWAGGISVPVAIGEDVWIGRGVAVLRGSSVGPGAVVGANSVVNSAIPARAIVVGAPARVVRFRQDPSTTETNPT